MEVRPMKTILAGVLVLGAAAAAAAAHDHSSCPMASSAGDHRAAVDHRHHEVTGVGHQASVHHFLLAPHGGSIRLEVTGAAGVVERERLRTHLRQVARAFTAGHFDLPLLIHDQVPPGVAVMKKMKAAIKYEFSPTEAGGEVRISTKDPAALAAVHRFLRFQIEDHGTGDPTE
jgi:hypothetical protein